MSKANMKQWIGRHLIIALLLVSSAAAVIDVIGLSSYTDVTADAVVLFDLPGGYDGEVVNVRTQYQYKGLTFSGGTMWAQTQDDSLPRGLLPSYTDDGPVVLTFSRPIHAIGFGSFAGSYDDTPATVQFSLRPGGFASGETVEPTQFSTTNTGRFAGVRSSGIGFTTLQIVHTGGTKDLRMQGLKWQYVERPPLQAQPGPYNTFAVTVPGPVYADQFDYGGPYIAYKPKFNTFPKLRAGESVNGADRSVGYIKDRDFVRYTIRVASGGPFVIKYLLAGKPVSSISLYLTLNNGCGGARLAPLKIASFTTSNWKPGVEFAAPTGFSLPPGTSSLTVCFAAGSNLNYFGMVISKPGTGSTGLRPFNGTPGTVPGTVRAATFDQGGLGVAHSTWTPGSSSLRAGELIAGQRGAMSGIKSGSWVRYTVLATAATYTVKYLLTGDPAKSVPLKIFMTLNTAGCSGPQLGVYSSAAWDPNSWAPPGRPYAAQTKITLPAGVQTLTVCFAQAAPMNYLGFELGLEAKALLTPYKGVPSPVPGTIAAINFDNGGPGVAYSVREASTNPKLRANELVDGNAGSVSHIKNDQWMRYTVSVKTAGRYTVQYLLAGNPPRPVTETIFLTLNEAGCFGTRLAVYQTSAFDTNAWQPAKPFAGSTSITLPAGSSTLTVCFKQVSWVNFSGLQLSAAPARELRGGNDVESVVEQEELAV